MPVQDLTVRIGSDISDLQAGINKASAQIKQFGTAMKNVGQTLSTRLTAPIAAFSALTVKAFAQQEKAELQLRAALQANGREVDSLFNSYNSFAKEMQRITVVGDEVTLSMLSQAESLGLTGTAAQRAVQNSIAMQSAFGVNAQSALRYTAALEQGNATMLTRYIPTLRDIDDESERAAEAQRVLARAFSAAEAEALSTSGQLQQMKNAWGDFLEVIGGVISKAILPLVKRMKEWAEAAQNLNPRIIKMGVVIAGLVAAIGPALFVLGQLVIAIGALISPIGLVIAAVGALGVAFVYLRDNWEAVKERFTDISWWRNAIIDMIQFFLEQNPFQYLIDGLNFVLEKLGRDPIGNIFDSAVESLEGLKTETKEYENQFGSLGTAIKNAFKELVGLDVENPFRQDDTEVFSGGGGGGGVGRISASLETAKRKVTEFKSKFTEQMSAIGESSRVAAETVHANAQRWPASMMESLERMKEMTLAIANVINFGVTDMVLQFTEGLGQIAAGTSTMDQVFVGILKSLADMAVQIGKIILASGLGIEALKKSLVAFTGIGAIVAGAALIAIGTAAKSALGNVGKGGGGGGASVGSFQPSIRSEQQTVNVTGELVARGNNLVAVLQNNNKVSNRVGRKVPLGD